MSIEEFSSALRDQAYKSWHAKSQKSILISSVKELRPSEQTAQKTSFMLRPADIVMIATKLAGREVTEAEINTIVKDLKNLTYGTRKNKAIVPRSGNDQVLYYPKIAFDNINSVLTRGFASLTKQTIKDEKGNYREARVSDFFHKGHVFGVATNILEQTISNLAVSKTTEEVKNKFIPILEEIHRELKRQDIETSNVGSIKYPLYAKYAKNKNNYLVEIQVGSENATAGRDVIPITNAIRRYFNPNKHGEISKFFRTRATEDAFIHKLITTKGSPSYKDLVEAEILASLTGKPSNTKTYKSPRIHLDSISIKPDTKALNKEIKEDSKKLQKLIKDIKSAKVRDDTGRFTSLYSIQTIINSGLANQIISNMGTPALNNRTGRFANSANVTKLSLSREGMLSVFYTYMKYPYQTFEPGFAQGSKQRDPRTLIGKSIRDIATTLVTNRLRVIRV